MLPVNQILGLFGHQNALSLDVIQLPSEAQWPGSVRGGRAAACNMSSYERVASPDIRLSCHRTLSFRGGAQRRPLQGVGSRKPPRLPAWLAELLAKDGGVDDLPKLRNLAVAHMREHSLIYPERVPL